MRRIKQESFEHEPCRQPHGGVFFERKDRPLSRLRLAEDFQECVIAEDLVLGI